MSSGPSRTVRFVQRLRALSEAECYARCYGARDERVSLVTRAERAERAAESQRRRPPEERPAEAEEKAA